MNLNHQLFFKVNKLVGQSKSLDAFSNFGSRYLIVVMLIWLAVAAYQHGSYWPLWVFSLAWLLGWAASFLLALIVKESRPYITYPQIKPLSKALIGWKSFPSDHTRSAFLIFMTAWYFGLPLAWLLLPLALWVSWGRIYGSAHYPADILAGVLLAYVTLRFVTYIL